MKYIEYGIVSRVLETWVLVRQTRKPEEFEEVFGRQVMYKFLQLEPAVTGLLRDRRNDGKALQWHCPAFRLGFSDVGP